jgi:hypothetical protein
MKRIFENSTFSFDFDESRALCVQHWYGESDISSYQNDMIKLKDLVLELPRLEAAVIYPNLSFSISPELQEWTHNNISSAIAEKFIKKCAVIVPKEVFDALNIEFLAIEQLVDETPNQSQFKYFTNENDAFVWFNE